MVRRYTATLMQTVGTRADLGVAAATGGNADTLARIFGTTASADGGGSFELAALERGLPALLGATGDERMARYNVKRDRAEVLAVAALVFATVARQLGIAKITAPGVGVREAVLIELAEAARDEAAKAEGAHDKALLTAARAFANRVDHDTTHGEHVRQLARALFHQLRDVHGLPDQLGVLLEVGALLHDVGEVVNPRGHHKHSEYMIRWGRIPGLDDTGRELVALMARGHRKDPARVRQLVAEAPLTKEQRGHLRKLIALLRLADGLDTEHRSRIEQVVCTRMGETVVLDLVVRDGPTRDDSQLLRKADMFREELGLELKITVARPVPTPVEPGTSGSFAAVRPS
jgi:exopolyphosphatase/guanosine-5'-triphosphate,3'-diphosphate pyrophosphatase